MQNRQFSISPLT
jgi:hypothetical protein